MSKYITKISELYNSGAVHRPRSYCITTFGCQMNARDSEKISGILTELGISEVTEEAEADIVIFNTCTIRENANDHLYGRLGRLKKRRKDDQEMIIALCGCMMQEADEVELIRRKYPYIDMIFGTHNFYTFPELLYDVYMKRSGVFRSVNTTHNELIADSDRDIEKSQRLLSYGSRKNLDELEKLKRRPVIAVWKDTKDIVEDLPSRRKYPFKQGVNIMYGCNNFCSYCIVPYVRGREKDRCPEEILSEVRRLGEEGVREIMLLGQNVNSYGKTLAEPMSFAELLRKVDAAADAAGISRVRFMTSHPKDLSDELIESMAECRHVVRQFHLPVQSGSDEILRRMNRHYDRRTYLQRVEKLRNAMPDISLSTDIIVGFPGETDADFEDTLELVRQVRYASAFTFIYSPRTGTPAALMEPKCSEEVVARRFERLMALQTSISAEICDSMVGRRVPVLLEEVSEKDPGSLTGRLENNMVVHVPADREMLGSLVDAVLDESFGFYFGGHLE